MQRCDPENRLLWKQNRSRLDFEALRDSFLAVSGKLDREAGGPSVEITTAQGSPRRTVYGFIDRQNLPGLFRTFDFASPDVSTAQRYATTVPQQALFLLNSPFILEQAKALANRRDVADCASAEARIDRLYRLLYGRGAEPAEIAWGVSYVNSAGSTATAWASYAQVLLLANEFAFVD